MAPGPHRKEEELYRAALELPAADRRAFISSACGGDVGLERAVEALLANSKPTELRQLAHEHSEGTSSVARGSLVGHYRVDGVLGAGGMGIVYRATDTRLDRTVAIKFLSKTLLDVDARRRFQREAQLASTLNHPHIVTVHDVGEHAGAQYIVTELVDGCTLADWLHTEQRTWRQKVELMIGVADALATAHDASVLHRDIKPANVLVSRAGYAKLADFGLAKSFEPTRSQGTVTTRVGTLLGTVEYMAPEQLAGRPLDARSDVFAFGVLLYEALAGRRPFGGHTDVDLMHAIMHAEPEPLPTDLPEAVRTIVEKATEKDPAERYQSMRDLVVDLRRVLRHAPSPATANRVVEQQAAWRPSRATLAIAVLATIVVAGAVILRPGPNDLDGSDESPTTPDASVGAGPTADVSSPRLASTTAVPVSAATDERASIAVLPFVNLSSDREQEYFSDGLSEELLNQLAQIEELRVIARTSSFAFKGQATDLRAVGRTLGVSHLLEGSVRKSGDTLRIFAQLIDASDGSHLWSDTYNRRLVDVFVVQEEIARTVAAELSLTLNVAAPVADYGGVESFEAYDHYLRGLAHANRFEADELERGIGEFRQALAIEPEYGLAWSALANAAQLLAVLQISRTAELLALQEDAISRALAAASDRWEVHAQYANLLWQRHDWVGAARAWAEARRLAPPGAPEFRADYGDDFLVQVGRAREGRDALLAARAADPLAPLVSSDTVVALQLAGDFEAASAEYARCSALPGCIGVAFFHLAMLLHVGDRDAVIDLLNDYQTNQPEERAVIEQLARVWDSPAESLALLRTLPDDPAITGPHILRRFAILAAHYGDSALALALLREDYFERDGYVAASLWMPQMAEVRRTPEFKRLVRDLGLYDYWRDSGEWGDFCRPVGRDDFACS